MERPTAKARVQAATSGPTVDEELTFEQTEGEQFERFLEQGEAPDDHLVPDWTDEEEIEAKWAHHKDVIEFNQSYTVVQAGSPETNGALHLSTTWVVKRSGDRLKARLCARDFAKVKRLDLFAPGAQALTSRLVDLKAELSGFDAYTLDASGAHNTLPELEHVVVIPPAEWLDHHVEQGGSRSARWLMQRLLPGRRTASRQWTEKWPISCVVKGLFKTRHSLNFSRTNRISCFASFIKMTSMAVDRVTRWTNTLRAWPRRRL